MTVYLNDTEVVMDAEELPGFSYALWSLTEPDKVRGSKSTTFKLPATAAVVRELGPWHMGYDQSATLPTLKVVDGTAIRYEGKVIVAKRSPEMYELVAVGGNGGWVEAAKSTQLNELEMGETQVITKSYITDRWEDSEANLDAADAYPLIDYGSFAGRASSYDVPLAKVRPHPRVHRVLKTFFNANGYTVEAKGTFANLWKRIIIAPGTGRIQVADSYLTGNTATVAQVGTVSYTPTFSAAPDLIEINSITSDPGGNVGGSPTYYTAPYTMDIQATVGINLTATWASPGIRSIVLGLWNYTAGEWVGDSIRVFSTTTGTLEIDTVFTTAPGTVSVNDELGVGIRRSGTATTSCEVSRADITFTPTNIEYQANIAVAIGPLLPRLKVADLIKALNIQNLVFITDDREHRVELWRLDDYLKERSDGLDWSGRIHHTEDFGRIQQDIPSRVEFRLKEDDKDLLSQEFRQANELGYGDANVDIPAGWAEPYEVEVQFASTQTRATFDGLVIPTIWSEDADYQTDEYEHEPRLLITDGVAPGAWTFSGDTASTREEYPLTYFAGPRGSLSFADVGSIRGTVGTHWDRRLRWMKDGRVLECDLMLWDHETASGVLDFGRPVFLNYGDGKGWFYIMEVDRKRYGTHEPTRCRLIPLT